MKPLTTARKLDIFLPATPEKFRTGEISYAQFAELQSNPPEWLAELRRNGPHPRPEVARKLGIVITVLKKNDMGKPLTTAEIKDLLKQIPEWLETARGSMAKQRVEAAETKAKKDDGPGRAAAEAAHNAEKQPTQQTPSRRILVAVDYTAHAINHKGNGTVVPIGSLGTTQEMWKPQVAALSEKYQVITPDVRDHGESPIPEGERDVSRLAADLIKVPNEKDVDRAHFVGLSLDGAIAQTIALEHADCVVSLTLSLAAPKFGTPETWQEKAELVHDKGTVVLADTAVRNWLTDGCFGITPGLPAHFRDMIIDYPDDGYIGVCGTFSHFDVRERLAEITAPTLVIAGKQDISMSLGVVTSLHDGIEGSTMVIISPAKHLLNQETPGYFNSAPLAHIDGIVDQRLIAAVENKK